MKVPCERFAMIDVIVKRGWGWGRGGRRGGGGEKPYPKNKVSETAERIYLP